MQMAVGAGQTPMEHPFPTRIGGCEEAVTPEELLTGNIVPEETPWNEQEPWRQLEPGRIDATGRKK